MSRPIRVESCAHVPIAMEGLPEKEGQGPPKVVIWPCRPGEPPKVTDDVDSALFYGWVERNLSHPAVVNKWLTVLPLVDEPPPAQSGAKNDDGGSATDGKGGGGRKA